ncbi:uncharacterized protein VTP21DRAFT_9410 [Calcarisporiella thermophila]|uniref:uncharacterized protein n=1 Tax=Calcarisporiella thermophila TaxID=911321 RepID=UPI003742ACA1
MEKTQYSRLPEKESVVVLVDPNSSPTPPSRASNWRRSWKLLVVVFFVSVFIGHALFSGCNWREWRSTKSGGHGHFRPPCDDSYPWSGKREYLFDKDKTTLSIKLVGAVSRSVVNLHQLKDAKQGNVTLDIHINQDFLQDEIKVQENKGTDTYELEVATPHSLLHDRCIIVDVYAMVPSEVKLINLEGTNSHFKVGELKTTNVFLRSKNGDIGVKEIEADQVSATTMNGKVEGKFRIANELNLETMNGAIKIDAEPAKDQNVAFKAKTINGPVTMNQSKDKFNGAFSLKTVIGRTHVSAPGAEDKLDLREDHRWSKQGSFGDEGKGMYIELGTINGDVELEFN